MKKLIERIKTYEAKRFQSLVFKAERAKWKVIKKIFPNYLTNMEKLYKKERKKQLKKAKTQEEINNINNNYKENVMAMKREYYTEQNMNYHFDINNPDKLLDHLNNNKRIHKFWIKIDAIAMPILVVLLATGNTWTIPLIAIVGLEAIKNLECINLQNYSIDRYNEKKDKLEKISTSNIQRKRKKYGEAQDVITKVIEESEEVPSIDRIISEAKSKESLEQLKEMLLREKEKRLIEKEKAKVKSLGGI